MDKTVITLPETAGPNLCLRLTGTIAPDDFTEFFGKPVERIATEYGYYNLFIHYDPAYEGWTQEAADRSFRCISEFSPRARRLAYINAPDSRMLMMRMLSPIMKAEVKYFDEGEKDEALEWVLAYKHAA